MLLNSKKKPFSTIALNDLETLSLITSMITIYCGLYYISDMPADYVLSNPDATNVLTLSNFTKLAFFGIIMSTNIFFLCYWCYKMYQEVKAKIRKTIPKIYLCLCLCMNKDKLEREFIQHRLMEENEFLKE